jgi:stress-induced morphogen
MPLQISAPAHEVFAKIRDSVRAAIPDAEVEVGGGGAHFEIRVTSGAFNGKTSLARHRMVYAAIAHLMKGEDAPIHAIDRLETGVPDPSSAA